MKKIAGGLILGCLVTAAFADAPVVDYSTSVAGVGKESAKTFPVQTTSEFSANLSIDQRINKLEQQINNLNGQSLLSKIEELQQNLQKINGELESQKHQIEQLDTQLKGFYQDLNQRLEGKSATPQTAATPAIPAASNVPASTVPITQDASIVPAAAGNIAGAFSGGEVKKNDGLQPATGANTDSAFLKEQQMYQTAIDLLPDKKHESENKLREYLKQYPKGIYVANAHYWLGEINFLQKSFDAAEEEFKIVIDKYSKSKRVADAMLKLALVHQNQGRDVQAKQELNKVVKNYPGTSAAQLAKQQLAGK